ncbi:hypothetical protein [Methylobacterium pseudosasicola]|uniref:hypothetical protein n=1 Tax=Methylobacterium pseudosasicola TaxID=582667 RepID=UPI0011135033|nr:hypothetical protein [Methylobacterium pseudosasicola]
MALPLFLRRKKATVLPASIKPSMALTSGEGAPPELWLELPLEPKSKRDPPELPLTKACAEDGLPWVTGAVAGAKRSALPDISPFHPPARAFPFPAEAGLQKLSAIAKLEHIPTYFIAASHFKFY